MRYLTLLILLFPLTLTAQIVEVSVNYHVNGSDTAYYYIVNADNSVMDLVEVPPYVKIISNIEEISGTKAYKTETKDKAYKELDKPKYKLSKELKEKKEKEEEKELNAVIKK
jgi:hypothetical protein